MLPSRRAKPPPEETPGRPKFPRPPRGAERGRRTVPADCSSPREGAGLASPDAACKADDARRRPGGALDVGDLDERIHQAEQRLMAREQLLGRRVGALGQCLRQAVQPRRLVVPLLGGAAALLATGWWAGRRTGGGARGEPAQSGPPPGPPQPAAEPWWASLVSLVWPLLPREWREQAGPAAVLALGLGLVRRHRHPPPEAHALPPQGVVNP